MSVLLLRYLPWIAGVIVVFGAGTWTGYHVNPWKGHYTSLQLADAKERADGMEAVRKALSAQLAQAQATSQNNADSLVRLANENAQITADRDHTNDLVKRLLARQARPAAAGSPVPASNGQPGTLDASPADGDASLANLLGNAHDECERNANQLDQLIAQVMPQVN